MIRFMCVRSKAWNVMISSIRLMNSGRKCALTASITCSSPRVGVGYRF